MENENTTMMEEISEAMNEENTEEVLDTPEKEASEKKETTSRKPTRSRKRGPRIIEDDMDSVITVLTPRQEAAKNWTNIQEKRVTREILEHPIIAVEPAQSAESSPRVLVDYSGHTVVIRTDDFFSNDMVRTITNNGGNRQESEFKLASHMLGAYIPFIITEARAGQNDDGSFFYVVTGSRRQAMDARKKYYFFGRRPVAEGNIVKARVLMPTAKGVIVDALGVETLIPVNKLSSHKWINPIRDYPSGTAVYVQIESVESNRETQEVKLQLSRQKIDEEEGINAYNKIQVGMRVSGTVVSVDETTNDIRINLSTGVKAVAKTVSLNGERLSYGDLVSFNVKSKNDERRTVYGNCMKMSFRNR